MAKAQADAEVATERRSFCAPAHGSLRTHRARCGDVLIHHLPMEIPRLSPSSAPRRRRDLIGQRSVLSSGWWSAPSHGSFFPFPSAIPRTQAHILTCPLFLESRASLPMRGRGYPRVTNTATSICARESSARLLAVTQERIERFFKNLASALGHCIFEDAE